MRTHIVRNLRGAFALVSLLVFCSCDGTTADHVFVNGSILTMNEVEPVVEAFAVAGDRIIDVGTEEEIRSAYPGAEVVDFGGKTVMPGIIESHGHMLNLGRIAMRVDLQGVDNPREVVRRLRARVAETPAGDWIEGWGWDDGAWREEMTAISEELSSVSPENPVWLAGLHGYNGWANTNAMERAGITSETPDPDGGQILRDPTTGAPTGILANAAIELVTRLVPPLTMEQRERAFELAGEELLRNGLTSVHDADIFKEDLEALRSLEARNELGVRYYVMLSCTDEELIEPYLRNGPEIDPDHWLTVRSIKVFQDGSLGTRSALMLEPYSDAPDVEGVSTTSREELEDLSVRSLRAGMQVATHAIGDRSNRITLDAYEAALRAVPEATDPRFRIEHAQVVSPEDIPRFAELGVISSMQPVHATSDMPWAEDRVGPERIRGAYAWRSFLDAGVRVPLNSDFPGELLNPFYGMYAAETRQTPDGRPAGGWYPEQRLTRDEVLKRYLTEAAYAAFEEELKGKIAPGMLADFIVISEDIRSIPPEDLLRIDVEQTYVGGRLVYPRPAAAQDRTGAGDGPTVHSLPATPETVAWGHYDPSSAPVLRIRSGDIVDIGTLITNSPQRLEEAGVAPEEIEPALRQVYDGVTDRGPGGHILTGPIFVHGAEPGDVLEVRILSVELPIDYGYNGCSGFVRDLCENPRTRILRFDRERMTSDFGSGITVPLRPFFGSMGVAPPPDSGRVSSTPPGKHAGNIDNRELVAGTSLFIPVHVPGALFEAGDGHAAQGDGEVDQTAIETSLRGRLQLIVHKGRSLEWPRAETPTHFIVMGFDPDLTEATRITVREMVTFLQEEKGLPQGEAYRLASLAADLRITQLVDGNVGVHMMIPKSIF